MVPKKTAKKLCRNNTSVRPKSTVVGEPIVKPISEITIEDAPKGLQSSLDLTAQRPRIS
jgi:hypothetical protein